MTNPLVECVPNFSEGRNPEVIGAILDAIRNNGAVRVLDVSSDIDHNRTVVTMVGVPDELEPSILAGIRTAAELINLNHHQGVHPRFGATDVVPFVPLYNVDMATCVELARRVGQQVGETLGLPVYLYEHAATRPERRNLVNIRRPQFQYEQLKDAIHANPDYMPDFGPAQVGSAGATIIGAREILVAYNVFLTTDNLEIGHKIAQAIRASGGGLVGIKATAFMVNGLTQVSLNLTNYKATPIYRVVEMIRREAQRYGVGILSSELIGLAPQEALVASAQWYLQLDNLRPDQILENRLANVDSANTPLGIEEPPVPDDATSHVPLPEFDEQVRPTAFAEAVARSTPTPGGGAVSALVGGLAAALAQMVSSVTIGKKGYAEVETEMQAVIVAAASLRERLLDAVVRDVVAYNEVMAYHKRPPEERTETLQVKKFIATEVPLQVCRMSLEVLQLLERVVANGNRNAVADAAVGTHLAYAAIESASFNVRVNLLGLDDVLAVEGVRHDLYEIRQQSYDLYHSIIAHAEERAQIAE